MTRLLPNVMHGPGEQRILTTALSSSGLPCSALSRARDWAVPAPHGHLC